MKIVYFTQSLLSCWNHGNAHFLRGVLRDLIARGHDVRALERYDNWSLEQLVSYQGEAAIDEFVTVYPDLSPERFEARDEVAELVGDAELVVVHEWNDPSLVAALGALRKTTGRFILLFHDTHHRAVSEPEKMRAFDLSGFDGVLAFGETLSQVYRRWGWGRRVWTWHEAADTTLFQPPREEQDRNGLVWIGNWGDEERTEEIEAFLLRPAAAAGLPLLVHGVRYHDDAKAMLARYGARYYGWIANVRVPQSFAQHLATVHVPRRFYSTILPGIPTIRVFEALACGIPLVSAPWDDEERLFRSGVDFLFAKDEAAMTSHLRALANDSALRAALASSGLETIRRHHTCAHRVEELMLIVDGLDRSKSAA